MIKRCILLILILCTLSVSVGAFQISYDGKTEEYHGRTVTLFVNEKEIEFDMPAVILNSRTLVPARAVFEELGAEVTWLEAQQKVIVSSDNIVISMAVNSVEAFVGMEKIILDTPAKIINDRLMIPVRFAAESLGCEVLWDEASASVFITKESYFVTVSNIKSVSDDGCVVTTVTMDGIPENVSHFVLDNGNPRIVVDIGGAKLASSFPKTEFGNLSVNAVRVGQFQINPYVARVVVDVDAVCEYDVVAEGNTVTVSVSAEETEDIAIEEPVEDVVWDGSVTLSKEAKDMLVVIDAGHGGSDVGAVGRDTDVLYEKDVNLAVSMYLEKYLSDAGVRTYMIRDDDVAVSLYDRPIIANKLGAELYLSVHSNSFRGEAANGTEVLYYAAGEDTGKFSGKRFAQLLQKELVKALGTYDRGITDGSEMYVIRKTAMPAVIAEMAFISNAEDRKKLADDEYRKKAAQAMAKAVIQSLNELAAEKISE